MGKLKTKITLIASALAAIVLFLFALQPGKDKNETLVKLNAKAFLFPPFDSPG